METGVANKDDMLNATTKISELIEKGIDDKFYESIDDLKYHLTYGRLSKKDVIDIKEAEAEYGDIVSVVIDLVKNTVKKDKTGVEGNEIAADIEQDKQNNVKPLWLHGVENPSGFVAKKKTLAIDESYYKRIMLRALGEYEEDLYDGQVSPIKGVDCQTLINDVKEFRDKLISGKVVLVEDTDMQAGDDIGYNEEIGLVNNLGRGQKKEEKVCTNGKEEISAEKEAGTEYNEVIDPAGYLDKESAIKFSYAAFWKRLRHLKSRRKSKSTVKVITETTLEDFETQLTKYVNNGYKIKYVNIDTKAGNSGSGVRYYAVVRRG